MSPLGGVYLVPPRYEQQSSSSSGVSITSHDTPDKPSPVEREEASTIARVEEDFISVSLKSYLLELNSSRPVKLVQGYVNTDSGTVSTTAILDEALDYNLISLARLQRLGLELEPPDNEDPVRFQFDNGEKIKKS
ncbi:hypothetical protein BDZ45DRAFT_690903 [Acephala macrosclerotiorum]|nr:hypothetical protein BDZ45DRAFT_690903 [Acephala macrosclerotiorum]